MAEVTYKNADAGPPNAQLALAKVWVSRIVRSRSPFGRFSDEAFHRHIPPSKGIRQHQRWSRQGHRADRGIP